MRNLKWSSTEKAIARKAFDRALQQELDAAIQSTKQMAAKIRQASELWELERYLTRLRKEIDRKYEYKYSVLLPVFGELVREGRLNAKDLQGLTEDKLAYIRREATRPAA
jgi:GTP-sensing pleiotropic transcriptional regulator CodY